jgi:hypothetical protein
MITKLQSPSQDLTLQNAEEDQTVEDLQQEIECPCCFDIMTLSCIHGVIDCSHFGIVDDLFLSPSFVTCTILTATNN